MAPNLIYCLESSHRYPILNFKVPGFTFLGPTRCLKHGTLSSHLIKDFEVYFALFWKLPFVYCNCKLLYSVLETKPKICIITVGLEYGEKDPSHELSFYQLTS